MLEKEPKFVESHLDHVATLLDVRASDLAGWHINRVRDDGAVDAYVPICDLSVEGVPVDPLNVERLVKLFDKRAKEKGGTGQRDPIVVGHVPNEAFYVLDGFHRHAVQEIRGQSHLHATIELNLTYEQVVQRRLEYAATHPEVEFSRQIEWIQSAWQRTEWVEDIPNVLTAFRAIQEDYAHAKTDDVELIDALTEAEYAQICTWVMRMSKEWGLAPAEIREKLASVESFDPELLPKVFKRKGPTPLGRISLQHVAVIKSTYPGEFDMQGAIVDIVATHGLSSQQTALLIDELEMQKPVSIEDLTKAAAGVDFIALKAQTRKSGNRIVRSGSVEGRDFPTVPTGQTVSQVLAYIRGQLSFITEEAMSGKLTAEDLDNALEVGVTLAELVAVIAVET